MVTIPMLNEIATAAVSERLEIPSRRLHGILPQSLSTDLTLVLFPYGMLLGAICSEYPKRCDKEFLKGFLQFHDLMLHLLRSLQHLSMSTQRLADKAREDFEDFQSHSGEGTWTSEIDLKAPYGWFHHQIDTSIFIDSCMVYLRVLGDCAAKTVPAAFQEPPFRSLKKGSLNDLRKSLRNLPNTPLAEVMSHAPMEWIDILARIVSTSEKAMREGIRDARIHHGACHSVAFEFSTPCALKLIAQQYSATGMHSTDLIGDIKKTPRRSNIVTKMDSTDLIGDIKKAIEGFFAFLDHIIREAVNQEPKLDIRTKEYTQNGHLRVFGPSDFLSVMIPVLRDDQPGDA